MPPHEGSGEVAPGTLYRPTLGSVELLRSVPARFRWTVAFVFVAASLAYAFLTLRHRIRPWNDFAFIYAAGRAWLQGSHPYQFDAWNAEWAAVRPPEIEVSQPMPFMYPPYWAPVAVVFAALPWPVASRLWDLIDVGSFLLMCALCLELGERRLPTSLRKPEVWIFVALAAFNPSLHYSVWQSQMSVVSTLGVVGAFWAFRAKKTAWLAVFAFVAALKPQIALVPLVYIFMSGGHAGILAAAGAALASALVAEARHLDVLPAQLTRLYELHLALKFNTPSAFTNIPALLASHFSGHAFMTVGSLLAIAAAMGAAWLRRREPRLQSNGLLELGLAMAITAALMPIHAYDLVIYCPIAILAYQFRAGWRGMLLVTLVLLTARAHVFSTYLHFEVAGGYLTGLMAILMLALVRRPIATSAR